VCEHKEHIWGRRNLHVDMVRHINGGAAQQENAPSASCGGELLQKYAGFVIRVYNCDCLIKPCQVSAVPEWVFITRPSQQLNTSISTTSLISIHGCVVCIAVIISLRSSPPPPRLNPRTVFRAVWVEQAGRSVQRGRRSQGVTLYQAHPHLLCQVRRLYVGLRRRALGGRGEVDCHRV
jgi:hypothetical protein